METNLRHFPDFLSPQWCLNGQFHTVACSLTGDTNPPAIERITITTPDDDFLELDCAIQQDSDGVVALFHGLEGSSQRYYMIELMKELLDLGFSAIAVNFRSCGSRMNRKRRFYHSGETNDYTTVFNWIRKQYPHQKIAATGFSLGGNALLKYLGEKEDESPLEAAVAVSVPYDLRLGSMLISRGFNRLYEYRFLKSLRQKLDEKRKQFPDLPVFSESTLFDFDDQITAPIHGFRDAEEYYDECSSRKFIETIATPTLLIHSRQDPICPAEAMPVAKIFSHPFTDYILTDVGGHVGFWSKPQGWLSYMIGQYIQKKLS